MVIKYHAADNSRCLFTTQPALIVVVRLNNCKDNNQTSFPPRPWRGYESGVTMVTARPWRGYWVEVSSQTLARVLSRVFLPDLGAGIESSVPPRPWRGYWYESYSQTLTLVLIWVLLTDLDTSLESSLTPRLWRGYWVVRCNKLSPPHFS